jgi:hypothetical protein
VGEKEEKGERGKKGEKKGEKDLAAAALKTCQA